MALLSKSIKSACTLSGILRPYPTKVGSLVPVASATIFLLASVKGMVYQIENRQVWQIDLAMKEKILKLFKIYPSIV